jgi:hypothetical protein
MDCAGQMARGTCASLPINPFVTLGTDVGILGGTLRQNIGTVGETSYLLVSQLFVPNGKRLSIAAGTSIFALPPAIDTDLPYDVAPAIVVERGGIIEAAGTAASPVTMTTIFAESMLASGNRHGKWGGLVVLGKAPTNSAPSYRSIEGIPGKTYGGVDPTDYSGTLQYVRVWHAGATIAQDDEINGITFGGVGNNTIVDHCEVAYSLDDGFEFFGGTVNVRFLTVLYQGDDAFDADEGYQGMGQFLFAVLDAQSHHGAEMDSRAGDVNAMPRSHPAFYSMTIVAGGSSSASPTDAVMRLREGTGGKFGNVILANLGGTHTGVEISECGDQSISQTLPEAASINTFLYVSPNFIIDSPGSGRAFTIQGGCSATPADASAWSFTDAAPIDASTLGAGRRLSEVTSTEPRPECDSAAYSAVDAVPVNTFFTPVGFKGAFGNDMWIEGWSYLSVGTSGRRLAVQSKGCEGGDLVNLAGGPSAPPAIVVAVGDSSVPGWGFGVFAFLGVLSLCFGMLLCYVVSRERKGQPVFLKLQGDIPSMSSTSATKGISGLELPGSRV